MSRSKFNKRLVSILRFIYKVGIVKTVFLLITVAAASEEYSLKWKGRQVHLRKGTSDLHVFMQVLAFEQYKIRVLDAKNVHTIIDLGANIGLSVIYLKAKYPNACIIAVEPDKGNFDMLEKNVAHLPDVHCVNKAIWHTHKTLGLFDTGGGAYSYLVKEEANDEIAAIPSVTINELVEEYQLSSIDLLKIDIEGSEKELFSANYQPWLSKVGCIVIELHDWFRSGCASSFFRAIDKREYRFSARGENTTIIFDGEQEPAVTNLYIDGKNKFFANAL